MASPLRDVAIVGVYTTKHARRLGRTRTDSTLEAVRGALDDAGLHSRDVDGVAVEWPGPGGLIGEGMSWAPYFNGLSWAAESMFDTAGIRGIAKAAAAIAAGLCEVAVVGGGPLNQSPMRQDSTGAVGSKLGLEFSDTWGAFVAPHFALVAQRHMHEFGTTPEQLATVAATIRNNGHENPSAMMYQAGPYTAQDVLNSRMVSTPFHFLVDATYTMCRCLGIVISGGAPRFSRWPRQVVYGILVMYVGTASQARRQCPAIATGVSSWNPVRDTPWRWR